MARLPIVNGDDGAWGEVLNEYLEVSLNSDGTLSPTAVSNAGAELTTNKNQANGYAGLNSSSVIPLALLPSSIPISNLSVSGPPSSTTYLRGDGTWATPNTGSSTLAGDTDVNISTPTNNQVLTYNSGLNKWVNQAAASAPVTTVFGRTGAVVASTGDYTAAQVTGAEQTVNKGAASGYAPLNSSSLVPTTNLGTGTASSANYLRGDGTWTAAPSAPVSTVFGRTGTVTAQSGDYTAAQVGALPSTDDLSAIANANATAGNIAMNSHKITGLTNGSASSDAAAFGQIPTSLPPNGSASGDLSGSYPSPTVAKLQGTTLSAPTGGATSYLNATGSWSVPAAGSSTLAGDSDVTITSATNAQVLTYNSGTSKWTNQGLPSATSSGLGVVELTGDLGGTATSPQVTNTHLSSALPVNQGGTGSISQNFVDLTSSQSIGGTKTFTNTLILNSTSDTITVNDSSNIVLGTTTGTKIGTTTTQKLGFYNSTPVTQPSGDVITALSNLGLVATPTVSGTDISGPTPRRVLTLSASSNTYTPNCGTTDIAVISSPSNNFTVANPTSTPVDGQELTFRIASGTTGYTPSWGTYYLSSGVATLPTSALPASKTVTLAFTYDANRSLWILMAFDSVGY